MGATAGNEAAEGGWALGAEGKVLDFIPSAMKSWGGGRLTGMGYDVFFTVKFPGLLSGARMQREQAWEQGTSVGSQDKETRLSQGAAGTGQIQRELSQKPWQVADELDVREG